MRKAVTANKVVLAGRTLQSHCSCSIFFLFWSVWTIIQCEACKRSVFFSPLRIRLHANNFFSVFRFESQALERQTNVDELCNCLHLLSPRGWYCCLSCWIIFFSKQVCLLPQDWNWVCPTRSRMSPTLWCGTKIKVPLSLFYFSVYFKALCFVSTGVCRCNFNFPPVCGWNPCCPGR